MLNVLSSRTARELSPSASIKANDIRRKRLSAERVNRIAANYRASVSQVLKGLLFFQSDVATRRFFLTGLMALTCRLITG